MSPLRRRPDSPVPGTTGARPLAAGRSSEVHVAAEDGTGRRVVLKVARPGDEHAERVRAVAAGHAAAGDHAHLLTLLRLAAADGGRPALVLESCGPWQPPPPGDVTAALADLTAAGEGVAAAHAEGLVHGRLQPGKLLRTRHGAVVVTGVAPAASARAPADPSPYTAPELLEGAAPGPEADVYGLAAVAYRALTGRDPFPTLPGEAPAAVALRVLRDVVAPIVTAEVPLAVSDVLVAALDKDPRRRPPGVPALLADLRAAADGAGAAPPLRWAPPAPVPSPGDAPAAAAPDLPPPQPAPLRAPQRPPERRVAEPPAPGRRVVAPVAGERRRAPAPAGNPDHRRASSSTGEPPPGEPGVD